MARKRSTTEQIIAKRREAEVALAKGDSVATVVRQLGVAEQTDSRWRREYGGLHVAQAKRRKELEQENQRRAAGGGGSGVGQHDPEGRGLGKLLSPVHRRQAVRPRADRAGRLGASGVSRSCGKRGARNALRPGRPRMRPPWWRASSPWRRAGRRVPAKPPRRRRWWLADGTTTRRRATRPNHVWSDDFVQDRTHDGRPLRLLCVVAASTRACLAIVVARRLRADDVLACLTQLFVERGPPTSLRSDNGPACTAHAVRSWLPRVGVTTLFIQPGSPWENGSVASFNGNLRDACLNRESFTTLAEAQVLIARWRREYNEQRPHSVLGYRPPAPPTIEARPAARLPELLPLRAPHWKRGTKLGGRSPGSRPRAVTPGVRG